MLVLTLPLSTGPLEDRSELRYIIEGVCCALRPAGGGIVSFLIGYL